MRTRRILLLALSLGLLTCMYGTQLVTRAQSPNPQSGAVGLTGTLPTDAPTQAPSISVPSNGQSFTSNPITVSGVCQSGLLIKIFKNGVFAGSAECSNGAYSVDIDLFSGQNDLIARAYDALDQSSPDSAVVTVTFIDSTPPSSLVNKLNLSTNYARRGANPTETLVWPFVVSGGTPPYAISVEWGDGRIDLISRTNAGEFELKHIYESPGVYRVVVKATDAAGDTAYFQVVAQANGAKAAVEESKTATDQQPTRVVWLPMLLAVPMIIVAFWLGRRYQTRRIERLIEIGQSPFKK